MALLETEITVIEPAWRCQLFRTPHRVIQEGSQGPRRLTSVASGPALSTDKARAGPQLVEMIGARVMRYPRIAWWRGTYPVLPALRRSPFPIPIISCPFVQTRDAVICDILPRARALFERAPGDLLGFDSLAFSNLCSSSRRKRVSTKVTSYLPRSLVPALSRASRGLLTGQSRRVPASQPP